MARIAFCQNILVEFMGYMYMSSALKESGHIVEVFIDTQQNSNRFLNEVNKFNPDIVCFSILSPTVPWALRVSRKIKEHIDTITIFGNIHAILNPGLIEQPGVDVLCIGEGEQPLKMLADRVQQGESYHDIPSLTVKAENSEIINNPLPSAMQNLDDLPFHDREMYDKYPFFRNSPYLRFMMGRGCPFHCSFCSNAYLLKYYGAKQYIRKLSPERAIAELEYHVKKRKPKSITFIDEVFWVKNSWLSQFLPLYKERIGIKYLANFRFGPIKEEDIIKMADSGAKSFTLAVESGDESQRTGLLKKTVKDEDIFKIANWFRKHRISFFSSSFFGLPDDTVEGHLKNLAFYQKLRPTYLWTTFFQPYPGIALFDHPASRSSMRKDQEYAMTFHHELFLDIPDRVSLTNLKKVYFLMVLWPRLTPIFSWLIKYKIPILFDVLFVSHFTYYIFRFENLSFKQYISQIKVFGLMPLVDKTLHWWDAFTKK